MTGSLKQFSAHGPEVIHHLCFPSRAPDLHSPLKSYSVLCLILQAVASPPVDEQNQKFNKCPYQPNYLIMYPGLYRSPQQSLMLVEQQDCKQIGLLSCLMYQLSIDI